MLSGLAGVSATSLESLPIRSTQLISVQYQSNPNLFVHNMSDSQYINYDRAPTVSRAIETRRSLRAFLPETPSRETLEKLITTASRAPSGTNMQPWQVYVVQGETREKLIKKVSYCFDNEAGQHESEQRYYPREWFEPYISRRRKVGWDLYGLLGIQKGDKGKMHNQHRRNFQFFDAPVGLIMTIHRDLETGSWLDYGMFIQNLMLLAREAGLHSCPQAAWADYPKPVREVLGISEEEIVVCGMAIGYADDSAVENTLMTEREILSEFVKFLS